MCKKIIILSFVFPLFTLSQISIDTSFEGANARILLINNAANTVKIESKLRTGDIHNVVFYCKISGFNIAVPLKIQVKYSQTYYLPVLAAYSYDKFTWFRYSGTIVGDWQFKAFIEEQAQLLANDFAGKLIQAVNKWAGKPAGESLDYDLTLIVVDKL